MQTDIAILGGGLAGLAAAACLPSHRVVVLEASEVAGGRARTQVRDGFRFNLGPHALYNGGHGRAVLRRLGIEPRGRAPVTRNARIFIEGHGHPLPLGLLDFGRCRFLSVAEKLELTRVLLGVSPPRDGAMSLTQWLDDHVHRPRVRRVVETLLRLSTYTADTGAISAAAALRQFGVARGGVTYVDGGWQWLVEALRKKAGLVRTDARVVEVSPDGWVRLDNGEVIEARAVISAVPPPAVASTLGAGRLPSPDGVENHPIAVRAACLDVALSRLPVPDMAFALDADRALYYSVHSLAARLAPEQGGAVIHVAKYLQTGDSGAAAELEGMLDQLQPGWREVVVHRRFMPHVTVTWLPAARVADVGCITFAGDWTSSDAMLADAALASGAAAADRVAARLGGLAA